MHAESSLPYGIPPPRFRLPASTRIGRVLLQVANLPRSLAYYQDVLGLRVQEHTPTRARLTPQRDSRVLIELREKSGVAPPPPRGAFGLFHFAILLPSHADLGRFIAHLVSRGVRFGAADHLVSEAIYLTDPDGLGIEVYADRPRDTWRTRQRELAMTTDPLDLDSLMDAAGTTPWSGAPAGTTIGHLHLHVSDLAESEAFYHAALGLDKVVWSYPGALFLSAGGYHHHLGTNTWSPGPAAHDEQARLLEWELVVDSAADTDAAAASLRSAGFAVEPAGAGVVTKDPWGTSLRIRTA